MDGPGRSYARNWKCFDADIASAFAVPTECLSSRLVLGEGCPTAKITLIGEAPGAQEDLQGRPFVGPAGRILDELLEASGLTRSDVWITNVVKCRPYVASGSRLKNRSPSAQEFARFLPWLGRELELVSPRVVVALGATAGRALLGKRISRMRDVRGSWQRGLLGIDTLLTYHPSFLLRRTTNRDTRYHEMVNDLRQIHQRLARDHDSE